MNGPTLVILAAGRARRYGGLKQLAPIGRHGEGVIDLIASDAIKAGFDDIVIVINRDTGPTIQEHVAEFWPKDHRVAFAFQETLRGTVDAVLAAEEFVNHGVPFRQAHEVIGKLVAYSIEQQRAFGDMSLEEFQRFSPAFAADVTACLNLETAMTARKGIGAPSPQNVKAQLARWRTALTTE